jgi:hypothetical protein
MNERITVMLWKARALQGYRLDSLDGEIGTVNTFYFDDRDWGIRYLVVETGNWLTGRQVLISPDTLLSVIKEAQNISINLTKKQIDDSLPLDSDQPQSEKASGDPHLRSTQDVSGHHLQAADGEIGHVEDFIIDDEAWVIRYLIIDTRNWWPGKKVLISPQWIERRSWSEKKVFINLSRETIKQSPEYTEETRLTRDYETQMFRYYRRRGYWIDEAAAIEKTPDHEKKKRV